MNNSLLRRKQKIFDELSPPPSPTTHNMLRTSSTNALFNNSPTGSPRHRANSETAKWSKFMNADESVRYMGLVWKRKGLSIKKRHLLLTNYPRLLCIQLPSLPLSLLLPLLLAPLSRSSLLFPLISCLFAHNKRFLDKLETLIPRK